MYKVSNNISLTKSHKRPVVLTCNSLSFCSSADAIADSSSSSTSPTYTGKGMYYTAAKRLLVYYLIQNNLL